MAPQGVSLRFLSNPTPAEWYQGGHFLSERCDIFFFFKFFYWIREVTFRVMIVRWVLLRFILLKLLYALKVCRIWRHLMVRLQFATAKTSTMYQAFRRTTEIDTNT